MDGPTDGPTNRQMDAPSYRGARTHLKRKRRKKKKTKGKKEEKEEEKKKMSSMLF